MRDEQAGDRLRIAHIVTVPETLGFLRGQIAYMRDCGVEVHVIASPGERLDATAREVDAIPHAIAMLRSISPMADVLTVLRLCSLLRGIRPAIVHSHTPKGNLLGMVSAWLSGVPVRVCHLHGLIAAAKPGMVGKLLMMATKLPCRLADEVFCVSHSVRDRAVELGVCPADKIKVIANGSIGGVDAADRFNPLGPTLLGARERTRERLGIPQEATVVGFVGRLVRDKGVEELVEAWLHLRQECQSLHLLVVGPMECHDPLSEQTEEAIRTSPNIHWAGQNWDTPPFYAAMDLVVLPSYREGFPVVPLEAAAMQLPVVATRVIGCVDAVVDGHTGTLVPPRDAGSLRQAIGAYVENPGLRRQHGEAARERVLRDFDPGVISRAVYGEYARLLRKKGITDLAPVG